MFRILKKYKGSILAGLLEIIIVFVGISISLYIDDWREERENQIIEQVYLKELYSELSEDFKDLQNLKNRIEKKETLINLVLKVMYEPDSVQVEELVFKRAIGFVFKLDNFVSKDYTFNDLTSTGNMKLITDSKLRKLIYQYYNYVEQADKKSDINGKIMTDLLNDHIIPLFKLRELMDYDWVVTNNNLTGFDFSLIRDPQSIEFIGLENVLLLRLSLLNTETHFFKNGFKTCYELRSLLGEKLGVPDEKEFVKDFMNSNESAIELYQDYLERYPDYLLIEMAVNGLAYESLKSDINKAIELFQLNKLMYPDSPNVYDSLGDGFLASGNKDSALVYFQKAYEMNPGLIETKIKLDKLKTILKK